MTNNAETLDGSTLIGTGRKGPTGVQPQVPCLTIAYHPVIERIGDQLRLTEALVGKAVDLSRLAPDWRNRHGQKSRGLNDPFVSRKPLRFSAESGGIKMDTTLTSTSVRVNGQICNEVVLFSAPALEAGVVLELADRVVIVLHWAHAQPDSRDDLGLLGVSAAMSTVRTEVRRVGPETVPVLLRGLSGTGKELVAQAIHAQSTRARSTFVAVNMGALPASTAVSELFGHVKGAFTGATNTHPGYFGQADSGTLFLDEIGETPSSIQPILLRALENGEIQPLGSQRTKRVDTRIIAATDADLEAAIEAESFRVALLHRLAGYEIHIPILGRRREDIGLLFMHFFRREIERLGMASRLAPDPTEKKLWLRSELIARLVAYKWPGNVRQLKNVARQLAIASKGENEVVINAAIARLLPGSASGEEPNLDGLSTKNAPAITQSTKRANLADISDDQLVDALRANQWKIAATARDLSISKNSLYQLMDRCALIRKAKDLAREEIQDVGETCEGNLSQMAVVLEVSRRGLQLRMTELNIS